MRIGLAMGTVSLFVLAGCAKPLPNKYPRATYTRAQLTGETGAVGEKGFTPPPAVQEKIDALVLEHFPPPWTFDKNTSDPAQSALIKGHQLYKRQCLQCHGFAGGGDGPTALGMLPRPRDFRRGVFKWKSTSRNDKPTRADMERLLREGIVGTSMPAFGLYPNDQLSAVTDYVIYLSQRGEFERGLLFAYSEAGPTLEELGADESPPDEEEIADINEELEETAPEILEMVKENWESAEEKLVELPEDAQPAEIGTEEFEHAVVRGRDIYLGANAACSKCHGADGQADPRVTQLAPTDSVDIWGNPNPPRNLILGLFRGGRQPIDLYRRIHEGIAGSSMPGQGQNPKLSKQDICDMVSFLQVLPSRPELLSGVGASPTQTAQAEPVSVRP